jgi:hypothetical protein
MNQRLLTWRLICGALFERGAVGRTEVEALLRSPRLSWPHVVNVAGGEYVTPELWLALVAARLDQALPEDARHYLRALYEMNLRRNSALIAQIDEAVDALNGAGVAPLLMKGAAYLKLGMHRDAGTRVLSDLDVLVPIDGAEAARRALVRIGYGPSPVAAGPHRPKHHLVPLAKPGGMGPIELHVAAVSAPVQHALPTADVWRHRIEHASGRFSVSSPAHAVLHRFIHDQIVDRYEAQRKISLRSLSDLLALDAHYGPSIDWAAVRDQAERAGYGPSFRNYLYVASRSAGVNTPLGTDFGLREAAHLRLCESVVRWNVARAGFGALDALSAFCIKKRYGERQSFLSMSTHRARIVAEILRSKLRRDDGTSGGVPRRA